jgi:hypothetical protein
VASFGLLSPSHKADLLARASPTRPRCHQDGLVPQKALYPGEASFHLLACLGYAPLEIHLAPVVGNYLTDTEAQHRDPGGGRCDNRSLQPSLELPADPVHNRPGGEGTITSPATL